MTVRTFDPPEALHNVIVFLEISSNLNRILTTRVFKPLNVIIFLANPDEYNKKFIDGHYNDSGFKFLNFPLYTTVKVIEVCTI